MRISRPGCGKFLSPTTPKRSAGVRCYAYTAHDIDGCLPHITTLLGEISFPDARRRADVAGARSKPNKMNTELILRSGPAALRCWDPTLIEAKASGAILDESANSTGE